MGLLYLKEQDYQNTLKFISTLNEEDEILPDYSYGQVYFEIIGKNKNEFLNKLTQFDLRSKNNKYNGSNFNSRIDCYIYNLKANILLHATSH